MSAISAAVALSLVLNGTPVELEDAILMTQHHWNECQVIVPVRALFEKLGYLVEWRGGEAPYAWVVGHWQKLPESEIGRGGCLLLGKKELRNGEYQTTMPFAPEFRDGVLYAPMIAVRVLTGAILRLDAENETVYCDTHWDEEVPTPTIGEILGDIPRWAHRRVHVRAEFVGYEGDASCYATNQGAPAPAAWAVADGTGSIYYTELVFLGAMGISQVDYQPGQPLDLTGVVRLGYGGVPYLSGSLRHRIEAERSGGQGEADA